MSVATISRRLFTPLLIVAMSILGFAVTYRYMGVEKHFEITAEQRKHPWFSSFYISCMAFSNAMGDATPKTMVGRIVFLAQVMLGFGTLLAAGGLVAWS